MTTNAAPGPNDESNADHADFNEVSVVMASQLLTLNKEVLTPRQYALAQDAAGLLMALRDGHVVQEGPRVREHIIEIMSLFGDGASPLTRLPEESQKVLFELGRILRGLSAQGICLEQNSAATRHLGSKTRG